MNVVVAPSNPDVVYAGTAGSGVYVSLDGARTWKWATADFPHEFSPIVLVSPHSAQRAYVGGPGGLYRTDDAGAHWEVLPALDRRGGHDVVIGGTRRDVLYTATYTGVAKSLDGGETWQPAGLRKPARWDDTIDALAIDPVHSGTLYAGTRYHGLWRTKDGGHHWRKVALLPDAPFENIIVDPHRSNVLYARVFSTPPVRISRDGGKHWRKAETERICAILAVDPVVAGTVYGASCSRGFAQRGISRSTDYGRTWTQLPVPPLQARINTLSVDPRHHRILYEGTAGDGVLKSTDGGRTWRAMNAGLIATEVPAVVSAPSDPDVVYAGTQSGIFRSDDRGATWSRIRRYNNEVLALGVDPSDSDTVYAATWFYGLIKTTDGGAHWFHVDEGITKLRGDRYPTINYIAIDPEDPQTIFVSSVDDVVNRSRDGGATWQELPFLEGKIAIAPSDPSYVYVLSVGSSYSGPVFYVARSTDGGDHVKAFTTPDNVPFDDIAVDPTNPTRLLAASDRGTYQSNDGGETWGNVNTDWSIYQLAFDPTDPQIVYAASVRNHEYAGVIRSADGGFTWDPFNEGLTDPGVLSIAVSSDGRTVYAGSRGSGVFRNDVN